MSTNVFFFEETWIKKIFANFEIVNKGSLETTPKTVPIINFIIVFRSIKNSGENTVFLEVINNMFNPKKTRNKKFVYGRGGEVFLNFHFF